MKQFTCVDPSLCGHCDWRYRIDQGGTHWRTFGRVNRYVGRRLPPPIVQVIHGAIRRAILWFRSGVDGDLYLDGGCLDMATDGFVWSTPMIRERTLNGLVLVLLLAVPLWAMFNDQPFTITLATRAVIFALAAVGLNIALGLGGLVSLGHAAFFGIGGYAMGILAHHAQTYTPVMELPFLIEGTKSMPVIWLVAMVTSGIAAFLIGILSLRTAGVYFIMITPCCRKE